MLCMSLYAQLASAYQLLQWRVLRWCVFCQMGIHCVMGYAKCASI
jgi:hypothetical protein